MIRFLKMRELSIVLLMVAYILFVGAFNHDFLAGDSLSLLVKASVILIVMAIGQSFVLLTSNIDVSVGSIMGLSAAVCGVLLTSGYSPWLMVPIVILLGAGIGFLNGIGVSFFQVPSIIMTLGMLGVVEELYAPLYKRDVDRGYPELLQEIILSQNGRYHFACVDCNTSFSGNSFPLKEDENRSVLLCCW